MTPFKYDKAGNRIPKNTNVPTILSSDAIFDSVPTSGNAVSLNLEEINGIGDLLFTYYNEENSYYHPPMNLEALTLLSTINSTVSGATSAVVDIMRATFEPTSDLITRETIAAITMSWISSGNFYLQKHVDVFGRMLPLELLNPLKIRRMKGNRFCSLSNQDQIQVFKKDEIISARRTNFVSDIYGIPDHMSVLDSVYLSRLSTNFKIRFYTNGAHAGFILVINDPDKSSEEEEDFINQLRKTTKEGSFKGLTYFTRSQDIKSDAIKLIPFSDLAADRDQFREIKNMTASEVHRAMRVPPQILGEGPEKGTHFSNAKDVYDGFGQVYIDPLQETIKDYLNDHLPQGKQVKFKPFRSIETLVQGHNFSPQAKTQ